MFSYILIALLVYFLYQFIFRFVLPIARASRKMQDKVKEMQQAQGSYANEEQPGSRNPGYTSSTNTRNTAKPSSKDYIEFEEIK